MIQFAGSPLIKGIADRASDRAFRILNWAAYGGPSFSLPADVRWGSVVTHSFLPHEACLSIFEESGCFCYMHHTLFWRSKIRITTRTGTLRSSYHSPLARAQTSGKASPVTSNTNLPVQGLVTQHPRAYSWFQFGREVLLLFVSVSLNLCVIANSKSTIDVSIPL